MKKLILTITLVLTITLISGCGNTEYYCESEEHELIGNKCVVKTKKDMKKRYYCDNGLTPHSEFGLMYCGEYQLAKEEYYCESGYQDGLECVVSETTYDALKK